MAGETPPLDNADASLSASWGGGAGMEGFWEEGAGKLTSWSRHSWRVRSGVAWGAACLHAGLLEDGTVPGSVRLRTWAKGCAVLPFGGCVRVSVQANHSHKLVHGCSVT